MNQTIDDQDRHWMRRALELARQAGRTDEVPIGALLVRGGTVLGEGWNQPITTCDPTAHAEIVALRQAAQLVGNYRLPGSTLYVTLEPCALCAGALVQARVARVVYGAGDSRNGACGSVFDILRNPAINHRAEITGGVLDEDCAELLRGFFRDRRR
jgi:tRNA(adenine34) deaminase